MRSSNCDLPSKEKEDWEKSYGQRKSIDNLLKSLKKIEIIMPTENFLLQ